MNITISVAMCTHNGEKYIAQQLDSIFSQTHPVNEIIIHDDCSTDRTVAIIQQYQKKYDTVIKLQVNSLKTGIVKNFEKAINSCTGDIIFIADQDDIWHPDKISRTLIFFREHPDKDAVFHNLRLLFKGQFLEETMWESVFFYPKFRKVERLSWYLSYCNNVVTGAALAMRKPSIPVLIKTSDMVDKDAGVPLFLHDYLLAIDFSVKNKLGILDECLVDYRLHEQQIIGSKLKRSENLSPYSFYTNPNIWIKLWYINRRIGKLKNYTDLHPEIEKT